MGGKYRAQRHPWMPLALTGKAIVDAAAAAKMTRNSWIRHGAFSVYSLVAAAAAFLNLPLTLPEACAAIDNLLAKPTKKYPPLQLRRAVLPARHNS